MSVAQIIEKLRAIAAKSPVASKEPRLSVTSLRPPVYVETAPIPSKGPTLMPEVRRRSLNREQAVNRLLTLVRAGVDALITGDKKCLESVVKDILTFHTVLKRMYGEEFADSVFSEAYSRLDGVGKEVLSLIVEGGLDAVLGRRGEIVANYVSSALKRAGVPVSHKTVKEVVVKSKLDMRKLAEEIKKGLKKVLAWSSRPHAVGSDARKAVEGMRAALAVALGVGGAEALKAFQRSFKGDAGEVFRFFAKSAFKPVRNEELMALLMSQVKRSGAKAGSVEDVAKVKSQVVLGEGSGSGAVEGDEVIKARAGKVMEALKRG